MFRTARTGRSARRRRRARIAAGGRPARRSHLPQLITDRTGIGLAQKVAACRPLGIKTTLASAHLSIDESEAAAFAKLNEQFGGLFRTEDFIEGRKAEAAGRPPVYQGK